MPTAWETFPLEVKGGLVTNISPLQQGLTAPGSARRLTNFEPSIEGGYKRVLGYTKYDEDYIPPYGEPLVQGSGQTGTTLILANIFEPPVVDDLLSIAGVSGFYTVMAVSFDSLYNIATLTLDSALASSPADKATVTFGNNSSTVEGLIYFKQRAVVSRGGNVWQSDGTGWIRINIPTYGTVRVSGAGQTGTTLTIDGLTGTPQQGDTFIVSGVEKVYTVVSDVTVTSGSATLNIYPALASSPANNALLTFKGSDRSLGTKLRFERYGFTGTPCVIGVDGANLPFKFDGTTFTILSDAPSDVIGASHVVEFKNHIFFANGNTIVFTAPYADLQFSVANGAGTITLPHEVTSMIVFREQLIVFSTNQIHRIVGNTIADFQLQPISLDIGCIRTDTTQEVGGDIAFLGPDGVRLLSATDKIGDFGLAVASRPIQTEVDALVSGNTSFASCVIRGKNQYRLFGYSANKQVDNARGVLATQFADQTAQGMAWAETLGILAYVADSVYSAADASETILFANRDGFVYRMESGNSFDGVAISAQYFTPHLPVTDPRIRKTFYKLTAYVNPEGSISGKVSPKLDFNQTSVIQPPEITLTNEVDSPFFYGSATYGVSRFGGRLTYSFTSQMVGSGLTVSLEFTFEEVTPPFSMDAITIEFTNNDRQ